MQDILYKKILKKVQGEIFIPLYENLRMSSTINHLGCFQYKLNAPKINSRVL